MVQVSSAASLSQEKDKTYATPKQPMVGESTGEGLQQAEDRAQRIYFDLNFQKRINDR